jgi:hypothetical protein
LPSSRSDQKDLKSSHSFFCKRAWRHTCAIHLCRTSALCCGDRRIAPVLRTYICILGQSSSSDLPSEATAAYISCSSRNPTFAI